MKKLYKLILLLYTLLLSCESPNGPISNSEEFFPLSIGNKWYYNTNNPDSTTIDDIWEITGQKVLNNKEYYEMAIFHSKNNLKDTLYYRLNGDTLFSRRKNYNELIVADFSLTLNEPAYWQNDLKVTHRTENTITFETPFRADYGYIITFKKGVGITVQIQNGIDYQKLKLIKSELK